MRLTAAAGLVDGGLEGGRAPCRPMGGYVLKTGRLVAERLEAVATRIGSAHRFELDEATLDRLRAAVRPAVRNQSGADGLAGLLDR